MARMFSAALLVAVAVSTTACTGMQNWKNDVENKAASNACNEAGWTEATGRHAECIQNTRTAWAQQRAQEQQMLLAGGLAVAAGANAYRNQTSVAGQQLRRAELLGSQFAGTQLICQYQTESGIVQVIGSSGTCPAEYIY